MKSKQNAFFNGYIIILCLCFLCKLLSYFGIIAEFGYWNRFVVAATVSTCFFCVADAIEQYYDLLKLMSIKAEMIKAREYSILERNLEFIEKTLSKEEPNYDEKAAKGDRLLKRTENLLQHKKENNISLDKKIIYYINLVGFMIFLSVFIFEPLYQILISYQDILTIFAFIVVLVSIAYKDHRLQPLSEKLDQTAHNLDRTDLASTIIEIYRLKEEKENGQNEDAHA